jgi:hypothetical protein
MDFSEKDAARSKFKLTQRNSRGRGRGGGGRGGGGRGGRKAAGVALDLGTNEYRQAALQPSCFIITFAFV